MALLSAYPANDGTARDPEPAPTILIVDDEPDARTTLELLLIEQGYTLAFAGSGTEALARAADLIPDLILLDVMMPDMDGIEVCRRLRADSRLAEVPIILVTAQDDYAMRLRGIEAGADDFLSKLFDEAELLARVRTITRLNRYRRLLIERAKFERVVYLLPHGLLLVDPDGTIALANPAMLKLLGAERPHQLQGQLLWACIAPEEHERCRAWLHAATADRQYVSQGEMAWIRQDGTCFSAEVDVGHFIGEARPMVQFLVRDVTERKRAAEALLEERNLLRTLIDNLPGYVYVKDTASRFIIGNCAIAHRMGAMSPDVLVGKTDSDFYPPDLAAHYYADEQTIIQSGQPLLNHEEPNIDPSGRQHWLLTTKVPLRDRHGTIVGLVGMGWDITEHKRLEAQLLQAQKMESIGQLAGGVAHDFNNLLTAIRGYCDLAAESLPAHTPARDDLAEIKKATQRAANLTHQLLAFARKQIIEPRVINLNDLILDIDKLLRRVIGEDIDLITRPTADLGLVSADPGQIEQVLVNLAINARDAMPDGGKLMIETANVVLDQAYAHGHVGVTEGDYVLLAVSDTGRGMDETVKSHMFEPFFTTKEDGRGTGLGLATCYGIVQQHGGHIWVYSEPHQGTSFKIYLPRVTGVTTPLPQREPEVELPRGSETVLLVEDDGAVRELAARVLRNLGYSVLEAADGEQALHLAAVHVGDMIALLLTDVVLPQLNGKMLADRVVALHPGIKVLFMSGYTDNAIVHHGRLDAGVAFLPKPFAPATLARKVRDVLGS